MNSMSEIWKQVFSQVETYTSNDSTFTIYNGYKIEKKNTGDVLIFDTRTDSSFYSQIDDIEEEIFLAHGFLKGADMLSIRYYESQLHRVNDSVKYYLNTNKTNKLRQAKAERKTIMEKLNKNFKKWKN
ncbi:MAG: hypothetical protein CMJ25_30925 [Phycisphaerae bacterium]|nr:hypothetical protein [Phycisphaerae bacterium]|tara:strand:- start:96 stop:479 length:384 start_codon:yes stop_codon:yes gene_type:complete